MLCCDTVPPFIATYSYKLMTFNKRRRYKKKREWGKGGGGGEGRRRAEA